MDLIEAHDISANYNHQNERVFAGLFLTVRAKENVSILGPSGSGKSTLLKILADVKQPSSGRVKFASIDERPLRTGLMFQQPLLLPWLTVEENVRLGGRYRSCDGDPLDQPELIAKVGLADMVKRRPQELSGGQRQRAALARTLVRRPDVLLLDEPFSSLDVELRSSLRELVLGLAGERRIPIVLVTHQPEEAAAFGGRTVNMNELVGIQPKAADSSLAIECGETANV